MAWHNADFSVAKTPYTKTEKTERLVFLPTHLKGLHVVFRFMAHLDNTAVGQNSIGLTLRSAAMDTGGDMHGYTYP